MNCHTCEHFDGKRCLNRDSDYYDRIVSPTNVCLDYEPEPDPGDGSSGRDT